MVKPMGGWTVAGLMDVLFGPEKLSLLAHDITEARKRAEFLREVPDAAPVQQQLCRLSRAIAREADGRHLTVEGDYASGLAQVTRRTTWGEPDIDQLAFGYSSLDRMVRVRIDELDRLTMIGRMPG